jgi:O-antigen/teichoic acid export membrane protein
VLARIKNLFGNLAIYGLGDVATSLVSLLLLPVYTRYLTPTDYGVIAMLLTIEAVAKIAFRWGVDTAFIRLYYDCTDQAARQRLASSIFFFLLAANGSLVALGIASAAWLSTRIFGTTEQALLIALVLANTFVAGFSFIPFQVLRISERSRQFISLVFGRSAGTLVMRLVLVVGAEMGVLGVVMADVIVTIVFAPILAFWLRPLIRPVFSRDVMRAALGFGLPRIPHSIANQVIGLADRYFLNAFGSLRDVGLYSIGASFGLAPKLFLSAFETAWTPFFLGVMREPDAQRIYSTVSTYALAVPVLLVAALGAAAPDLVRLTTTAEFHEAAAVTPWIALGVMFQGVYVVGSIGIVITKRTGLYPLATGAGAAVSLLANALLIPRFGMMGAAWANAIAYGALATVTVAFSWRVYPIRYEWGRLLRVALAGLAAYVVGSRLVPLSTPPLAGLFLRTALTGATYLGILYVTRFFHAGELRMLRDVRQRALQRKASRLPAPDTSQVEMAGEIVTGAPDPALAPDDGEAPADSGAFVSPGSRSPRR